MINDFLYLNIQVNLNINTQIAVFRDLLIQVGTREDAPKLRLEIRRARRQCVEDCQQATNQLLPQVKRYVNDCNYVFMASFYAYIGIPMKYVMETTVVL